MRVGPQADHPLVARVGPRRSLALAGDDLGSRPVLVPGERAVQRLDVRIRLAVRTPALDLRPVAGDLVVGLDAQLRRRAGLAVDLNRAFAVPVERADELVLGLAPQHAHVPNPVIEDRLQVFGAGLRREGRRPAAEAAATATATAATTAATLRVSRQHAAHREGSGKRARRDISSKRHQNPLSKPVSTGRC